MPKRAEDTEASGIVERLDAIFTPWNRTDIPGLVVGVMMDGEVLYRRGFGMASLETSAANTPRTRMRIGSISKHFTSLLALLLAEERKLDLDAPIRSYVPELTGTAGEPSLRLLMEHRGGLRCYVNLGLIARGLAVPPPGTVLATLRRTNLNFEPGEAVFYNNSGYYLICLAIERTGGASFEEQLKQRLFDPLGMVDTASVPSDYEISPGMATMHLPLPNGRWRRGLFPSEEMRGDGAIVSTIDDMFRWMAHFRRRDRFGVPSTWAALTRVPILPDGTPSVYALGLMMQTYRGLRTVQHAGGVIGASSQLLMLADWDLDIIILANGAPGANPISLAEQIVDIVLASQLEERSSQTIDITKYGALLGDWWSPNTGMFYTLSNQGGALALSICGAPMGQRLEHLPGGRIGLPPGVISEIDLDLDEASRTDVLPIRFGGHTAVYERLSNAPGDATAFAQAAVGQYYCDEIDCVAAISQGDERLGVVLSDPYGRVEWVPRILSKAVAHIEQISPFRVDAILTLIPEQDRAMCFRLNTGRTRNLLFRRTS